MGIEIKVRDKKIVICPELLYKRQQINFISLLPNVGVKGA